MSWANSCPWRAVGKDSFREATIIHVHSWINDELLDCAAPRLSSGHICKCGGFAYVWIDIFIMPPPNPPPQIKQPKTFLCLMAYYLLVLISVSAITQMLARLWPWNITPVADCGMCVSYRRSTTPVLSSFTSGSLVPPSMMTTTSAWWMWIAGCAWSSAATLQPSAWSFTGSSLRWTYPLYLDYCCWTTIHNMLELAEITLNTSFYCSIMGFRLITTHPPAGSHWKLLTVVLCRFVCKPCVA